MNTSSRSQNIDIYLEQHTCQGYALRDGDPEHVSKQRTAGSEGRPGAEVAPPGRGLCRAGVSSVWPNH